MQEAVAQQKIDSWLRRMSAWYKALPMWQKVCMSAVILAAAGSGSGALLTAAGIARLGTGVLAGASAYYGIASNYDTPLGHLVGIAAGAGIAIMGARTLGALIDSQLHIVSEATAAPADACVMPGRVINESLFRPVETPDISLYSTAGKNALRASGGWFVVSEGGGYRVYWTGSSVVRPGPLVKDLSLLGPSTIPEVTHDQLRGVEQMGLHIIAPLTEDNLDRFGHIPEWSKPASADYPKNFETRLKNIRQMPDINNTGARLNVGPRGLDPADVLRVRDTVFDAVDRHPPEMPTDKSSCYQSPLAQASMAGNSSYPDKLVLEEFPTLRGKALNVQDWVTAHEVGHAIDHVVGLRKAFNDLPFEARMQMLSEMKELHKALILKGLVPSYPTGAEGIANVLAAYIRDPELTKGVAKKSAEFIRDQVNTHPLLKKLIHFS